MELQAGQQSLLEEYLGQFGELIGDKRTNVTFIEIVRGIINAGSLICQQIAAHSPVLCAARDGSQRVIRFVKGKSTKRSQVQAKDLGTELCRRGVAQLAEADVDELWVVADGSDLRKRYAQEMPDLMQVRDLDGKLVPGYRTLNVLGITPGRRGILYHRLFSSTEEDFISESWEVQQALRAVSEAVAPLKEWMTVTWILDRGFDDVAVWRSIWEQNEQVVSRIYHTERLVDYRSTGKVWKAGNIEAARQELRLLGTARAGMVVRRGRQQKAKKQEVTVEIKSCPLRLTYDTHVRREDQGEQVQKLIWLVEVHILRASLKPWLLITDLPVESAENAVRVFRMYRQRWAVEDSFKFTKEAFGWEDVQLLDLNGIRTLVALAWVAAGFLYELGVTLEWEEVQLLARLGGWVPRKDRPPGKIVLSRGLHRLMDMLATQAFVDRYRSQHGMLPPRIEAWLGNPGPGDL